MASWNSLLSHEAIIQMWARGPSTEQCLRQSGTSTTSTRADGLIVPAVRGTVRDDYAVTVFLASSRSARQRVPQPCSCPVGSTANPAAVLSVARLLVAAQLSNDPSVGGTLDKLLAAVHRYLPQMSPTWRWSSVLNGYRRFGGTWGGRICASARHDAAAAAVGAFGDSWG